MKAAPKVELIRQLIQITVCLKGSKVATVETVHNIHKRLKTEKMLLSHTDAPVMFVKLSCVLVLESLKMSWCKSCRTLFSFQQTVHFLRLAPLSSTQCTHFLFFVVLAVLHYTLFAAEKSRESVTNRTLKWLSASATASTCTMLLSVSLNCSFLLITSLTSSFSSSCSLFTLFSRAPCH